MGFRTRLWAWQRSGSWRSASSTGCRSTRCGARTTSRRRAWRSPPTRRKLRKAGEWLALYIPGADLDPREFEKPEKFDLDRENNVHIAFGAGPHRCLGAHLARVELQVLYQQILKRLP